jgi:hypothetical protein
MISEERTIGAHLSPDRRTWHSGRFDACDFITCRKKARNNRTAIDAPDEGIFFAVTGTVRGEQWPDGEPLVDPDTWEPNDPPAAIARQWAEQGRPVEALPQRPAPTEIAVTRFEGRIVTFGRQAGMVGGKLVEFAAPEGAPLMIEKVEYREDGVYVTGSLPDHNVAAILRFEPGDFSLAPNAPVVRTDEERRGSAGA